MRMPSRAAMTVALLATTLAAGCDDDPSAQPAPSVTVQGYTFEYAGDPVSTPISLPPVLSGPPWSPVEAECEQAGYSLLPAAGTDATQTRYAVANTYLGDPLYLHLIEKDQAVLCAFLSVREASTLAPGVFDLGDPNVW
jgi:hypothetical protein